MLTVLSAFSGLGGLDLGLEAAGFTPVGCIENDATARRSLKANTSWKLIEPEGIEDAVSELTPKALGLVPGELSLLAGGPPCQPFSKAAQWISSARHGLVDKRAHCLLDFVALAEKFLPSVILIENVPGFVRGEVSAFELVRELLASINRRHGTSYAPGWRILDAVDFGVPQRRVRAVVVARRDGERFTWPSSTHDMAPVTAWDAIGGLAAAPDAPRATGKWAALLPSVPPGENYLWHTDRGGGLPLFGYRTRYWSFLLKLDPHAPAWTLPAQPGPSTGPFHWDNRPLTTTEMLALQTFPTTWSVEGDHRSRVRQVGNATPPLLAEVLGRSLAAEVFGRTLPDDLTYALARRPGGPVLPPPSAVPAEYVRLIGDHKAHPGAGLGPSPRPVAVPSEAVGG